tara:strand:- start:103 stop:432 length:330 start_codon:yes stop_codon:yes gene_type:complete
MYLKSQIGKNVGAILLLLAIILPASVQFSHMIEGHEGIACNDQSTHIHKTEKTCEICAFQLTSLSYDIIKYPDLLLTQISVVVNTIFTPLKFHNSTLTNKQLRAPPVLS